jgi:hypothetical protein
MNKLQELQKKRGDSIKAYQDAYKRIDIDGMNDTDLSLAFDTYNTLVQAAYAARTELEDYMSLGNKDYVVVTAISSYRMRYVMHRDDLQKLNPNDPVNAIEWANDTVTMEECEEFSQEHMGEYIVDTVEMDGEDMLALFDKDNEYLREWSTDQKVAMVRKSI